MWWGLMRKQCCSVLGGERQVNKELVIEAVDSSLDIVGNLNQVRPFDL